MKARRGSFKCFSRITVLTICVFLFSDHALAQRNFSLMAAHAEQAKSCSDDNSQKILRIWLQALPMESQALIEDPVVRKAATDIARSGTGTLRDSAQRIFLSEAASADQINFHMLDKNVSELKSEFKSLNFPANLRKALKGQDQASRLYLAAALTSLNALASPDCAKIFRSFLVKRDERVEFIRTESLQFNSSSGVIQQYHPGTDDSGQVFDGPTQECKPSPEGKSFFNIQPNGRLAGKYSSLGFPEVVSIALANGNQTKRWSCTGVLLNSNWVLTAAHCINDGQRESSSLQTLVKLNERVAKLRQAAGLPISSYVKGNAHVLDGYMEALQSRRSQEEQGKLDLALLELSTSLDVKKPPGSDITSMPALLLGTLAGYGSSFDGLATDRFNPPLDVGWLKISVGETLISWQASSQPGSNGAATNVSCPGDSGAPIYISGKNSGPEFDQPAIGCLFETRRLIGLVSYGQSVNDQTCFAASTGAGPRLLPRLPWICKIANIYCDQKVSTLSKH